MVSIANRKGTNRTLLSSGTCQEEKDRDPQSTSTLGHSYFTTLRHARALVEPWSSLLGALFCCIPCPLLPLFSAWIMLDRLVGEKGAGEIERVKKKIKGRRLADRLLKCPTNYGVCTCFQIREGWVGFCSICPQKLTHMPHLVVEKTGDRPAHLRSVMWVEEGLLRTSATPGSSSTTRWRHDLFFFFFSRAATVDDH